MRWADHSPLRPGDVRDADRVGAREQAREQRGGEYRPVELGEAVDALLADGFPGLGGELVREPLDLVERSRTTIADRALDRKACTAERIRMTTRTEASETWQARIGHELAAQLRHDAKVLGLEGRTEIVKAALELLHRRAAEERMARSIDDFYEGDEPPLPVGVRGAPRDDRSDVTP